MKFRDFALERTFRGINFVICMLVLCVCIVILISLWDKLQQIRLNLEKHKI